MRSPWGITGKARPSVRPDKSQQRNSRPVGLISGRAPEQQGAERASAENRLHGGELAAAISTVVVSELASTTGRGPTRAKTTLGENAVFVVLQDTLTRGELNLVEAGESEAVLGLRRLWQSVMQGSCSSAIEELTGRKVVGFMSDNHIDPDIAVEVFILEPLIEDPVVQVALAAADPRPG
jgi:uncharacterized protein YbcI